MKLNKVTHHSTTLAVLQVNVSHTATLIHVSRLCVTAGWAQWRRYFPRRVKATRGLCHANRTKRRSVSHSVRESSAECSLQTGRRVELMPIFSSVCVCACVCVCVCVCVVWTPFIITFLHRGLHMGTSSSLYMTVITSVSDHRRSLTDQ